MSVSSGCKKKEFNDARTLSNLFIICSMDSGFSREEISTLARAEYHNGDCYDKDLFSFRLEWAIVSIYTVHSGEIAFDILHCGRSLLKRLEIPTNSKWYY